MKADENNHVLREPKSRRKAPPEMDRPTGQDSQQGEGDFAPGLLLPPLDVYGLVVTKGTIISALRVYVPPLIDIQPLEGDLYLLSLQTDQQPSNGRT